MLNIIKFKNGIANLVELENNCINVADTDYFEKAVNSLLVYSEMVYRTISEEHISDDEYVELSHELTAEYLENCLNKNKITATITQKVKGIENVREYSIPLFSTIQEIRKSGIMTQAMIYAIAFTNGRLATCTATSKTGKLVAMPCVLPNYHEFYELSKKYYDTDSQDESLVVECKKLVENLGNKFNTAENDGIFRKYQYSVKRKDVRTAMNIAVETLKFGVKGNIVTKRIRGERSASVQMAMLLLHIKPVKKTVKVENWVTF